MDITASLWPVGVEVRLGPWIYEIPPEPATVWIRAIADPDGAAIVPGLLEPADQRLIYRDFMQGHIGRKEFSKGWRTAVAAATGRPWWEPARLVLSATTVDNWTVVHGKLMQRGVDLDKVSIGGFCNIVHVMALEACKDQSERSQFLFDLQTPPAEVSPAEAHAATDAPSDFLTAMQQFQSLK